MLSLLEIPFESSRVNPHIHTYVDCYYFSTFFLKEWEKKNFYFPSMVSNKGECVHFISYFGLPLFILTYFILLSN